MMKILIGVGLGFLLFTNPEARQITGDLLRSAGNAIAPKEEETSSPNNKKSTNEASRSADDRYSEKIK